MRLQNKVAVVTGASMGIGEAIAKVFADEGASVVLSSRDLTRAEAARARVGHLDKTVAVACDVRKRADLERLLATTLQRFGRVDVWVNNAGHGLLDSVTRMDMANCRQMFDTNLFGAIDGMQVAASAMIPQHSGTIINISSVAGHIPLAGGGAYSGTKFALNAMGKAAGMELARKGVKVMTVCPGFIATDFATNSVQGNERRRVGGSERRRGPGAEVVARATLRGYLGGKREVVVPWWYRPLIKLYQLTPSLVEYGMRRMLAPADKSAAKAAD